jgi:hypothetical protein
MTPLISGDVAVWLGVSDIASVVNGVTTQARRIVFCVNSSHTGCPHNYSVGSATLTASSTALCSASLAASLTVSLTIASTVF